MRKLLFLICMTALFVLNCEENTSKPNVEPTCTITNLESNEVIDEGDHMVIQVDAEDSDGEIDEVRFYINDTGVSSDTEFPYSYEWQYEPGDYKIKAVAIDDEGERTADSVQVTVYMPTEYDGIALDYYNEFFIEDFKDNSNNWPVVIEDSMITQISDDSYNILNVHRNDAFIFAISNLESIYEGDFEIEVKLGIADLETYMDYSSVFTWGLNRSTYKNFQAVLYYEYVYGYINNFGIFDDQGSTLDPWILGDNLTYEMNDLDEYNTFTIRKYKDNYYFFLNEIYIDEYSYKELYGDNCGFVVYGMSNLVVDYLKIYEINSNGAAMAKTSGNVSVDILPYPKDQRYSNTFK